MREAKQGTAVSLARAKYTIVQEGREVGHETVTRRVFDDNRVTFEAENAIAMNPGGSYTTRSNLTLEEESYFPRSYRVEKVIKHPSGDLAHTVTVDMYANVAVLGSELRGRSDQRRVVVPTGVAIMEVGQLYLWHQLLFWVDPASSGRERIQWLDPSSGAVEAGELYVAGEETLTVLGKKTRVTVFKAERERLGPATLYVDVKKRIVKAEQNLATFSLVEWSEQ
jgi:hypothetical protein